jgi:hypothetical protein
MDPQSAFRTLTMQFLGVLIDIGSVGDFVVKKDAKLRRIKEVYQGVKVGLEWKLPPILVKDLVAYCVTWVNAWVPSAIN